MKKPTLHSALTESCVEGHYFEVGKIPEGNKMDSYRNWRLRLQSYDLQIIF